MRWRKKTLDEMTTRIVQLGLEHCPICHSGSMAVLRLPVVQSIGAVYREKEARSDEDREHNVQFMVQIACGMCGYAMLFDAERLVPADEELLIRGLTEEEEVALEADGQD
jgi:hypothetical protein